MSAYYYFGRDEQVTGPVGMEALRALLEQRRIDEQTPLWSDARDWTPLGEALPQFNPPPAPAALQPPIGGDDAPPPLPPPLPDNPALAAPQRPHWQSEAQVEPGWSVAPPHPWRRWLARLIDHYSLGLLGYVVLTVPIYAASSDIKATQAILSNDLLAGMAATLITLPLCALFLAFSGTTPGKWCAGIRVLTPQGGRLAIAAAFGRESRVWVAGLALGIPLLSLITMAVSYSNLTSDQRMEWDQDAGAVVHYREPTPWTVARLVVAVVLVLILLAALMGKAAESRLAGP